MNKPSFRTLLDISDIFSYIIKAKLSKSLLAFDVETTGGKIQTTQIIGISFSYNDDEGVYIPLIIRDELGFLDKVDDYEIKIGHIKTILQSPDNPKTAFNSKYDENVCYFNWGIRIPKIVADPMIMYYLMNEEEKFPNLAFMIETHFPSDDTTKSKVKALKLKDYSLMPIDELSLYGAQDSYYTRKLAILYRKKLQEIRGYSIC